MKWIVFLILGILIGGRIGISMCDCHMRSSGDAIGAVAGLFYGSIGALIGAVVGLVLAALVSVFGNRQRPEGDKQNYLSKEDECESQSQFITRDGENWFFGTAICPHSGMWLARVDDGHPLADEFNLLNRTAMVVEGHRFPNPVNMLGGVRMAEVQWRLVARQ